MLSQQSKKMGRPRAEKPTTSAERVAKYRSDSVKRAKENQRQQQKRKEEKSNFTDKQIEERRLKDKLRKQRSRENKLLKVSRQKKVGMHIVESNDRQRRREEDKLQQ